MLFNSINLSVSKIAATSGRKELQGVYFTSKLTCATDSFRLLEISTDSSVKLEDFPDKNIMRGCSPFMVEAEAIKALKLKPNKNLPILGYMTLKHLDDKHVKFTVKPDVTTTTEPTLARIDGRFPDYGQIFPSDKPLAEVKINPSYLAELLDIMAKFDNPAGITLKIYADDKPIVLEVANKENTQRGRAMLMPIRR